MKIIVGLGNPGLKYLNTRHNLGKMVVDAIARRESVSFRKKTSLDAHIAQITLRGEDVILGYLTVYMNQSGVAVGKLARHFQIQPQDQLLIVVDDFALPLGRVRLRSRGSAGGHNGLKSVEQALQTDAYARLRLGIGHPQNFSADTPEDEVIDFVLSPFESKERSVVEETIRLSIEACELWAEGPIGQAMSVVNQAPKTG